MKVITLKIPVIDTGDTPEQKRRKMLEELDELLNEFSTGRVNKTKAMEEMFDVIQVMAGYVLALYKEQSNTPITADGLDAFFTHCNKRHIRKMEVRAIEREWTVIKQ